MNLALPEASSNAAEVDQLLLALVVLTSAVLALVMWLMLNYIIRYRRGSRVDRGKPGKKTYRFEVGWTVATMICFFALFIWGSRLYVEQFSPPADSLRIYVTGKQWMWKVQHPGGQKEINALHVPTGRDVQLLMTSEDVIHDFSIPAFRIKHDVLPDRYETIWFKATEAGTYHLFCTQYCGLDHSRMVGEVVAMRPADYEAWLRDNGAGAPLAEAGATLFARDGCAGCHRAAGEDGRGPSLAGVYGAPVRLADGTTTVADDAYLRDAILRPGGQIVAGYGDIMPSYAGQVSEDELMRLIDYIKSLKGIGPGEAPRS